MTRNKLYLLLGALLSASYLYVIWAYTHVHSHPDATLCVFKNITGIACPSCGSTRALLMVLQGKIAAAGLINPFGYLIAVLMAVIPFWLVYDIILKKNSLFISYKATEKIISHRPIATLLITIVCINWLWNIYKGL